MIIMLILIGCALVGATTWWALRDTSTAWGLQISLVISTGIVSVAAAIGPNVHINFAVLYIWAAVYAALYFRPVAVVLQIGLAGSAYIVVLITAHLSLRSLLDAWTSIFGTAIVLSAVVFALVSLLRRSSREDPLTRLANRRAWEERIDEELERSRRNKTPLSLAVIDIDNFKAVNDRDGHQAGDRVLRSFADGWVGTVRGSGDFVARLGGDEFGLLAPGSDEAGLQGIVVSMRSRPTTSRAQSVQRPGIGTKLATICLGEPTRPCTGRSAIGEDPDLRSSVSPD
jgi:diguanylate cyclase (GGDEF)-like protein